MKVTSQEYAVRTVRAAAILTNSYVAGTVIGLPSIDANNVKLADDMPEVNFLALECAFTLGSLTSASIKVEFSDDNTTYYLISAGSISGSVDTIVPGELKLSASGNYYININKEFFGGGGFKTKYIKVSSLGTGTVTSSSLGINAVIGTV